MLGVGLVLILGLLVLMLRMLLPKLRCRSGLLNLWKRLVVGRLGLLIKRLRRLLRWRQRQGGRRPRALVLVLLGLLLLGLQLLLHLLLLLSRVQLGLLLLNWLLLSLLLLGRLLLLLGLRRGRRGSFGWRRSDWGKHGFHPDCSCQFDARCQVRRAVRPQVGDGHLLASLARQPKPLEDVPHRLLVVVVLGWCSVGGWDLPRLIYVLPVDLLDHCHCEICQQCTGVEF